MLLNELQKQHQQIQEQKEQVQEQQARIQSLMERVTLLEEDPTAEPPDAPGQASHSWRKIRRPNPQMLQGKQDQITQLAKQNNRLAQRLAALEKQADTD